MNLINKIKNCIDIILYCSGYYMKYTFKTWVTCAPELSNIEIIYAHTEADAVSKWLLREWYRVDRKWALVSVTRVRVKNLD